MSMIQLKIPANIRQQIAGDLLNGINKFEAVNKGADKLIAGGMPLTEAYAQANEYAALISNRIKC